MNKFAVLVVVLALLILGQPQASAIIIISSDYPMGGVSGEMGQATNKAQLSELIALYNNDVALLINPEEVYSKAIKEALPDPETEKKLRDRASARSDGLTLQSLSAAVSDMVKASPQDAHLIMASAIAMLSELPGGDSADNRITLAQTALLAISPQVKDGPQYAALIIGVAAKGQNSAELARTVIALRDFANSGVPRDQQIGSIIVLDEAMVAEGILRPVMATPEFVGWARAYAATTPVSDNSGFSGDQGATTTGGLGGFGGSSGGSGNSGSNPTPTPTPTPTPAPTPAS